MVVNKQNIRLIFGLKLKQLRLQKGLSFAQLSKAAGVSVSYLNEIEKGKKYPKTDKIIALAEALGVPYDQLVSLKLSKKLAPISELLNSGILESLPLELFGLDSSTLLELISGAPAKINAFISTILKISRNYEMTQENFYFAALRSYQEMQDNYFEDIEQAVDQLVKEENLKTDTAISSDQLAEILSRRYGYVIDDQSLASYPELKHFRSVYVAEDNRLYINSSLTQIQRAFVLGKELGFNFLALTDRPNTSNLFEVHSFEEVLNNFRASYFGVALLISRYDLLEELNKFFERKKWNSEAFMKILHKYQASPEMFLHRLSNVLPKYYGIDNFFFLRINDFLDQQEDNLHISKELHLSQLHNPHRNDLNEHYCRRWVATRILQHLRDDSIQGADEFTIEVQRSRYVSNNSEYFCISIAKPNSPTPQTNVSVTIGIHIDSASRKRIKFLESSEIVQKEVNETCERCPLLDCKDRVAPPAVVAHRDQQTQIKKKLNLLMASGKEAVS